MTGICFFGTSRMGVPLDATAAKKFEALAGLGRIFVVAFAEDWRPRVFGAQTRFYLVSAPGGRLLRYLLMVTAGPALLLWLVLVRGVRVVVCQSPYEGVLAVLVQRLCRRLGRRVVCITESHGDFETGLFGYRRVRWPGLYRACMRRAARFALRRSDLLRAVSGSTRRQLEALVPGKAVAQFPTWTDLDAFLERGARAPAPACAELVYAGTLVPAKGVHHLVDALALLARRWPEARLCIVGQPVNATYARRLAAQVVELGVGDRVCFVGKLPQCELAARMALGAVLCVPSTGAEGLPRVVLEGMACGRPVVASAVNGVPEVVADGETGFLVPPGDARALAERLSWLMAHPESARAMGEEGRRRVRALFSREVYVGGYRGLVAQAEALSGDGTDGTNAAARLQPGY